MGWWLGNDNDIYPRGRRGWCAPLSCKILVAAGDNGCRKRRQAFNFQQQVGEDLGLTCNVVAHAIMNCVSSWD
jgi:hypothetical protein